MARVLKRAHREIQAYDSEGLAHFHSVGASRNLTPEQNLQAAVLEDAAGVLLTSPRVVDRGSDFLDAVAWVTGQCWSRPMFAFSEVCESLGIDESALRVRLLAMAAGDRRGRRKSRRWLNGVNQMRVTAA